MGGDRRRTLSFEAGTPEIDNKKDYSKKLAEYDRSKLSGTPLADILVAPSHMVFGVRNALHDFDERLDKRLYNISFEYNQLLTRKNHVEGFIRPADLEANVVTKFTTRFHQLENELRAERERIRPEVCKILVEAFQEAFAFLIDHLDDHRLAEMKMNISQYAIAQVLYDNMDYYEDHYALGKEVRLKVLEHVKERASKVGESVLLNVLPGRVIEGNKEALEAIISSSKPPRMNITAGGPEQVSKSRVPTLPPPPMQKMTEEELRASVAAPKSRRGPLINPTTKTIPYAGAPLNAGVLMAGAEVRGTSSDPRLESSSIDPKEAEEVLANAERMSGEIPRDTVNLLPDLSGLFDAVGFAADDDELTGNVAGETASQIEKITSQLQTESKTEAESPEISVEEVTFRELPLLTADFNDGEDSDSQVSPVSGQSDGGFTSTSKRSEEYSSGPTHPPKSADKFVTPSASIILSSSIIPPAAPEKTASQDNFSTEVNSEQRITSRMPKAPKVPQIEMPEEETLIMKRSSWLDSAFGNLSKKVSSGWDWIKNKFNKYGKVVALAGGLAAASGMLVQADNNWQKENIQKTAASTNGEAPSASASAKNTVAPQTSNSVDIIAKAAPTVAAPLPEAAKPDKTPSGGVESKIRKSFAKILTDSKSQLVQDIINRGEVKLGQNTITDTMIDSFMGLANNEQKAELRQLQNRINLGIGVYFNEHFGSDAKVAASMSDPKLRNLYRTAKVAKDNGWFNSSHTRANFPQAYALGELIMADSAELGLDQSDNPNQTVKDYVNGNMFQSKLPGDTIHVRKADGSYHVIQEMVFEIFDGQHVSDIMDAKFSTEAKKKAAGGVGSGKVLEKSPEAPAVNTPAPEKKVDPKDGGIDEDSGKTGMILPNVHLHKGLLKQNSPAILAEEKLLREIDHGVALNIPTEQDKLVDEVDRGWDNKVVTEQDTLLTEADNEWINILNQQEKLSMDKDLLERTSRVEFDLPLEFTNREEIDAIIPTVLEKVAELYPNADTALVKKMIRQYGWIGMHLVSRERGHVVVELNSNFHKKILNPILQKNHTDSVKSWFV